MSRLKESGFLEVHSIPVFLSCVICLQHAWACPSPWNWTCYCCGYSLHLAPRSRNVEKKISLPFFYRWNVDYKKVFDPFRLILPRLSIHFHRVLRKPRSMSLLQIFLFRRDSRSIVENFSKTLLPFLSTFSPRDVGKLPHAVKTSCSHTWKLIYLSLKNFQYNSSKFVRSTTRHQSSVFNTSTAEW